MQNEEKRTKVGKCQINVENSKTRYDSYDEYYSPIEKKILPILGESFHCIHGPFHAHVVARTRTFGPLPLAWVALNSVSRLNHFSDQFRKWRKLFPLDQIKFLDKKYEVFKGCVEMRLLLKRLHLFKMVMIDMSVNPE